MDGVETWFSEQDIMAGAAWRNDLLKALAGTEFCVVCLDRRSLRSHWISFEVGFIANALVDSSICPYLVGMTPKSVPRGPLSAYEAKTADKDGTADLILAIARKQQPGNALYEQRVQRRFEVYWGKELSKEFEALTRLAESAPPPPTGVAAGDVTRVAGTARALAAAGEPTAYETSAAAEPAVPEAQKLIVPPAEAEEAVKATPKPPFQLRLFNTSYYSRKGYITHDWEPIGSATGIEPNEVVVRDEKGNELPSQVDYFGHFGPPPALVFSLLNEIPQASEDSSATVSYVTIERGKPREWPNHPLLEVEEHGGQARRVKLLNNSLEVQLELLPKPSESQGDWYAGAVTSVLLDGKEILDAFGAMLGLPDAEKRCMQLDRLRLMHSGGEISHRDFNLINSNYQLISKSSGPVRSVVTIASQPFNYNVAWSPGQPHKCRLFRVISLYKGVNYVTEELKVYGTHEVEPPGGPAGPVAFDTRYFSYMDVGVQPHINMSGNRQGWFAISSKWAPHQGYGFATNAELSRVVHPDPDFPKNGNEEKSFVWRLKNCREARCLHLFMKDKPKELEPEVRRAWHEVIDRPLVARIE